MTRRIRRTLADPVSAGIIGASRPTEAVRDILLSPPREALAGLSTGTARQTAVVSSPR